LSQRLRKDLLFNTILNVLTKAVSYFSYAIIAYIWGAKLITDIYYLGNSYVSAASGIFVIIISSIFSTVFVRVRLNNSLIEARKFAGSFIAFIILPVVVISFLGYLYSTFLFAFVSKIRLDQIEANRTTLSIFSIVMLMTVVIEFYKTYLQSLNHFIVVAWGYLLQAILFLVILFSSNKILGNNSLVVSLSCSMFIQILLLTIYVFNKKIWPLVSFRLTNIHKTMISVGIPLLIAHVLTLFVTYFIDYLASGYPAGYLTTIKYAQLIAFLPGLLFFTPLLDVISVRLSELYHTDVKQMVDKFLDFQSIVILVLMPVMCFFIFFRDDIVKILFLRGSFSVNNVIQTSAILMIYSITIVTTSLLQIISRLYYIMQKTVWSSIYAVIFQSCTLMCCYIFSKYFGFWGLPIGKVFVDLLIVLPISYWLISKYVNGFNAKQIFVYFLKILLLNLFLSFLIFIIIHKLFSISGYSKSINESFFLIFLRTTISFILFCCLYFFALIKIKNQYALNLYAHLKFKFLSNLNLIKENE